MLIKASSTDLREADITPMEWVMSRRRFMRTGAAAIAAGATAFGVRGDGDAQARGRTLLPAGARRPLTFTRPGSNQFRASDELTSEDDATHYNNFYEFGIKKTDPAFNSGKFVTKPWSVVVEGEVAKPGSVPLETILAAHGLEERIYRMRCVEAWSMVIPWIGIPLAAILDRFQPTSRAKYVAFETLHDPERMPGQKRNVLDWPYREGLRMDEARHPLTILAVGMYGKELPNQNGAPLRLVVPWKYGFKGIKSIVKIRMQESPPATSWNLSAPNEYGFYANVNPDVSHPRWSQSRERRIGDYRKRPTLPFNGYAEQVASLYAGMDLRRNF
jgi:sulfoxide reductase catalytic subunit YedY